MHVPYLMIVDQIHELSQKAKELKEDYLYSNQEELVHEASQDIWIPLCILEVFLMTSLY